MVVARILRALVALVAGVLLALAFPPFDHAWLGPVALTAFTLVCWRRSAGAGFTLGFLFGLSFFLVLVHWITVVGDDAWVALSGYCALWIALVGLGTALVTRLPWWPLWVAALWVAQEFLRDRVPWGGFPWGRLAFGQTTTPVVDLAALGGAPLVTFAVALVGALLALAVLRVVPAAAGTPRWGTAPARSVPLAVGAAAAAVGLMVAGRVVPLPVAGESNGGPAITTAAVVQGNVPELGLDFNSQRRAVLDNHVAATEKLAAEVAAGRVPRPELVIWPENSSDIDPFAEADAAAAITRAVDAVGVPILVGAVIDNPVDPATLLNVGVVWSPGTGPGERYVKRHPVPFGEYVPLRPLLSRLIGRFDRIPHDFAAGAVPGVLTVGPARAGVVICFEVAYDLEVREAVTSGGRVLVVQTNNATYGRTGQPEQQLAMTRLRAIEHGRATLVAATSGISAVISPDGTVQQQAPEFVSDTLVATVPLRDSLTLADRLGQWPEVLLAAVGVLALLVAAARRRGASGPGIGSTSRPLQEEPSR